MACPVRRVEFPAFDAEFFKVHIFSRIADCIQNMLIGSNALNRPLLFGSIARGTHLESDLDVAIEVPQKWLQMRPSHVYPLFKSAVIFSIPSDLNGQFGSFQRHSYAHHLNLLDANGTVMKVDFVPIVRMNGFDYVADFICDKWELTGGLKLEELPSLLIAQSERLRVLVRGVKAWKLVVGAEGIISSTHLETFVRRWFGLMQASTLGNPKESLIAVLKDLEAHLGQKNPVPVYLAPHYEMLDKWNRDPLWHTFVREPSEYLDIRSWVNEEARQHLAYSLRRTLDDVENINLNESWAEFPLQASADLEKLTRTRESHQAEIQKRDPTLIIEQFKAGKQPARVDAALFGRQTEIAKIMQSLLDHKILYLNGMFGVGKTTLVTAVRDLGDWRGGVWWLDAIDIESSEMKVFKDIWKEEVSSNNILNQLWEKLSVASSFTLIVLENIDDFQRLKMIAQRWLDPARLESARFTRIILTGRFQLHVAPLHDVPEQLRGKDWCEMHIEPLPFTRDLEQIGDSDARLLLIHASESNLLHEMKVDTAKARQAWRNLEKMERNAITVLIAEKLEGLPLGVLICARLKAKTKISWTTFTAQWAALARKDEFSYIDHDELFRSGRARLVVRTSVLLSMTGLSVMAREILDTAAIWGGGDVVTEFIFEESLTADQERALEELIAASLLTRLPDGVGVHVHGLVTHAVLSILRNGDNETFRLGLLRAVKNANKAFKSSASNHIGKRKAEENRVACVKNMICAQELLTDDIELVENLLVRYSLVGLKLGMYLAVEEMVTKLIHGHQKSPKLLSILASAQWRMGNLKGAIGRFVESYLLQTMNHDIVGAAKVLSNIGNILRQAGKWNAAIVVLLKAMKMKRDTYGLNHPEEARTCNNLAMTFMLQGKFGLATNLFLRSYDILEKHPGKEHFNDLATWIKNNLIIALRFQGKLRWAKKVADEAGAEKEIIFGPEHHETLGTNINKANVIFQQGDNDNALGIYTSILEMQERVLGRNHYDIARTLNNIARVLRRKGKFDEALSMYERSLLIKERVFGKHHYDVGRTCNNIGKLLQEQGRLSTALPMFFRALWIRVRTFGLNHHETAVSRMNIAQVLLTLEKVEESRVMLGSIDKIFKKQLGDDHSYVLRYEILFAKILVKQNKNEIATRSILEAINARQSIIQAGYLEAETLLELAQLFCSLKDSILAPEIFSHLYGDVCLRTFQKQFPATDPRIVPIRTWLTNSLRPVPGYSQNIRLYGLLFVFSLMAWISANGYLLTLPENPALSDRVLI